MVSPALVSAFCSQPSEHKHSSLWLLVPIAALWSSGLGFSSLLEELGLAVSCLLWSSKYHLCSAPSGLAQAALTQWYCVEVLLNMYCPLSPLLSSSLCCIFKNHINLPWYAGVSAVFFYCHETMPEQDLTSWVMTEDPSGNVQSFRMAARDAQPRVIQHKPGFTNSYKKITFCGPQHLESFSGMSSLLLGLKVPYKIHQSVWHQNSVPITALACLGDLSFIPHPQDKLPKFLCNTWKTLSFPQRVWVKHRDFSLGFMF